MISLLAGVKQKGLILSYRYHCLLASNPRGCTTSGSIEEVGCHVLLSLRIATHFGEESEETRQFTLPFSVLEKLKCWYPLMPGILDIFPAKKEVQSWVAISGIPSSHPTTSAVLQEADLVTTAAMSLKVFTAVFRNSFLRRPKDRSGENFVWPATIKESVILSLSPTSTLQHRYCKYKAMFFCNKSE